MDPNNLDPKLKETYDKVMGTPTTPQVSPVGQSPIPTPVNPVVNSTVPAGPVIPTDSSQTPPISAYTQDNLNFQAAIQAPVASTPLAAPTVIAPQHKTSSLLRILYIIGAIVFFVVYTFLWIKIFNLPLPF